MQTLTDQYRRMLGEIRFLRKEPFTSSTKLQELTRACDLLSQSLALIDPVFARETIKPIPYHPTIPLPGAALTRAVLSELRVVATRIDTTSLAAAIAKRHGIVQSTATARRIVKCIAALAKQGVVNLDGHGCILTHLLTSEKLRR